MIKYHYLLESLTGEPLELVKGFQVTEQKYKIAIQWLKDRFKNTDKLKQMLIHKLNNLPSPRHTLVELKQFVTLAKQLCTQINSSAEDHIKSTLTQKLPKSTYEQIVNHYGKFDFSLAERFKGIEFAIKLFEYQQFSKVNQSLSDLLVISLKLQVTSPPPTIARTVETHLT